MNREMLLLEPIYQWLEQLLDGRINHFPLIRLLMNSIDHALIFFIGWLGVWSISLLFRKYHKQKIDWKLESYLHLFIFYLLVLLNITIFRQSSIFNLMRISPRPLQDIYWVPFVDSVKLFTHGSLFAAYYNVFGNIIWFMPMGLFCGILLKEKSHYKLSFWAGLSISLIIEISQWLFSTGVTHIDDVICNALGSVLGYWCYKKYQERKRRLEL